MLILTERLTDIENKLIKNCFKVVEICLLHAFAIFLPFSRAPL